MISKKLKASEWGSNVVRQLSEYIRTQDPTIKGWSYRTIYKMVQFYETYSSESFKELMQSTKLAQFTKMELPSAATGRVCQNTQYKNIKLVVCPFMDAQRVFHFSVNLTFKSLVGNKYCVYRHK